MPLKASSTHPRQAQPKESMAYVALAIKVVQADMDLYDLQYPNHDFDEAYHV